MQHWHDITRFAAEHEGLVDRATLDRLGFHTAADRHRLVRDGRLTRVLPGVWRIDGSPDSWRQRLVAGLLLLGPASCISHDAASAQHRFDRSPIGAVEFTVPRQRRTSYPGIRIHTTRHLGRLDVVMIDGLRTTSATRTVIDLARARVPTARLEAAIDSAVRSGASAPVVLQRRLADLRGPGRWGCRRLDELLEHAGGHTMLERYFLVLMAEAGLPRPTPQVVFRDGSRVLARVDFLYPDWGIVVEVTGRVGHSTPSERIRDAQRRNELQDVGLRVFEYTYEDVTRRPAYVVETMEARLRSAGWTLPTT
jgi:hypothetical protein